MRAERGIQKTRLKFALTKVPRAKICLPFGT